jgi:hypothetical protein
MVDIYTKAYTDALTPEDFAKYKRPLISNIIGSLSQVRKSVTHSSRVLA